MRSDDMQKVHFVIDQSGSMAMYIAAVQKGIERSLETFDANSRIAFSTFNERVVLDRSSVGKADFEMPFLRCSGQTGLYDAVKEVLLYEMQSDMEAVTKVVLVITDGKNNIGETTCTHMSELIAQYTDKGYVIKFLGANMDAVAVAARMGIVEDDAITYDTPAGMLQAFRATSDIIASYQTLGVNVPFSAPQRTASASSRAPTEPDDGPVPIRRCMSMNVLS